MIQKHQLITNILTDYDPTIWPTMRTWLASMPDEKLGAMFGLRVLRKGYYY
jgi:hypothetical protein